MPRSRRSQMLDFRKARERNDVLVNVWEFYTSDPAIVTPADHTSGSLSVTLRAAALDALRKDVVFLILRYFSAAVNESVGTETSSRSSPDNPQLYRMNPP